MLTAATTLAVFLLLRSSAVGQLLLQWRCNVLASLLVAQRAPRGGCKIGSTCVTLGLGRPALRRVAQGPARASVVVAPSISDSQLALNTHRSCKISIYLYIYKIL